MLTDRSTYKTLHDKDSNIEAFAGGTFDASLCWKDVAWLKSITKLPILIKGVLTFEDVIKAIEAGVQRFIVSNHGAQQLDYAPATISVLEEVEKIIKGIMKALKMLFKITGRKFCRH